jgi:hypothetical protein
MKIPLDPQYFDLPISLAYQIAGAAISGLGIVATTVYGCYTKMAVISPEELALQPLHVVLILFIVALATFIALILRAVWGKGLATLNRFSDCLENLTNLLKQMDTNITEMRADQRNSLDKFQDLSLDALKAAKASKNRD